MRWDVNTIRREYLNFFKKKGHKIVASAPMVLKNDPTLMFTNAGMNQFKDVFLGNNSPVSPRVADSQKCLRVSGKHNDLEEVGVDTYHHTMFEMLGNWSFGDYFKKEAIDWAWELLTDVYQIDKSRLYITVFEGHEGDGTLVDEEAESHWKNHISADRILRCGKKDNFWEMGETGPCGPCSEIHIDIRPDSDREQVDGKSLVNMDHPQVIEIWNLVFIEFNRKANKELESLPDKHVDTGLGLERLAMVLQGKQSNYQADVFKGLLEKLEVLSGKTYEGKDGKVDIAFRVISDHVRAVAFSIADGQLPSNTGAGYVIRRILRRGVRYGYSFLDLKTPFIFQLVAVLVEQMGEFYPEIKAQKGLIEKVIREEEESFLNTLSKGLIRLEKLVVGSSKISGKDAFELYDTYGFPLDLTQLIASEKNVDIDINEFNSELQKQKSRSKSKNVVSADDWVIVEENDELGFVGYDSMEVDVKITRYRRLTEKGKEFYQFVLDQTPFYPEGGGQVGDTGVLLNGDAKIGVIDTQKENELIVHKVTSLPNALEGNWKAVVNLEKRKLTEANHSATHLLHFALRKCLGNHVEQKGSEVNHSKLRFDFSHFQKMSTEELQDVEDEVNSMIQNQFVLEEFREISIEEAKGLGAMSLFGEKYGDVVRMIQFGDSKELCGGTHVQNSGNIGRFKILSESSVASGIRRIEAITNKAVFDWYDNQVSLLDRVRSEFNNPKDLIKSIETIKQEVSSYKSRIEKYELQEVGNVKGDLLNSVEKIADLNVIIQEVILPAKQIKDIAFQLTKEVEDLFLVIGTRESSKAGLTVMLSENARATSGLDARNIIKEISPLIKGGGGGQDFFATAGGKNPDGIAGALDKAKSMLTEVLQ
ncbi:MAG: alanine--tRNA ligase [Crocinitomicaceae bacterium]|nr:alanine--tRNA ligase [Crocinitomicaceae bacterium]|tara:strand:- start:110 stop:2731 length:2622 start_codon:yes stop_codon:yes gene_type:complete